LATLQDRHVKVKGSAISFRFRAKSGLPSTVELQSPTLARIVKRCQDLPGEDLFQYVDGVGNVRDVESGHVNDYLRAISGRECSAKDFRTWAGTVLAARALRQSPSFDTQAQAKRNISSAIKTAAAQLGNTPSVCRKCYVHPAILEAYMEGSWPPPPGSKPRTKLGLSTEEVAVLRLLRSR
jgi:DNA topoisomerase-1